MCQFPKCLFPKCLSKNVYSQNVYSHNVYCAKMYIPIMSTVPNFLFPKFLFPKCLFPKCLFPKCLFPYCLLCQNVYSHYVYCAKMYIPKISTILKKIHKSIKITYCIPIELASVRVCVRGIQNNLMILLYMIKSRFYGVQKVKVISSPEPNAHNVSLYVPINLASVRVCLRSIQNNLMAFTIYCHYIVNFMVSKTFNLLAHLSRRITSELLVYLSNWRPSVCAST